MAEEVYPTKGLYLLQGNMGVRCPPPLGEKPGPMPGPVDLPSHIGKGFGLHFDGFEQLLLNCESGVFRGDLGMGRRYRGMDGEEEI